MNNVHISGLRYCITTIILMWNFVIYSQNKQIQYNEPPLTTIDSIYASKIPELKLPLEYKLRGQRDLPSSINNADLAFFRPTFSQLGYWNCGQSAGIGYNFCYEMNQARNLPGNLAENQYSVNFTWNFMNTGDGWGVSYFHSFDILKACGNPNLADYGGLYDGGEKKWISGYDLYEHAMLNRIRDVYSIDVSSSEGLITLKHWLNDHLNGSEHGGVANFYLSRGYSETLPDDSPEAGEPIISECIPLPAGHAMTIVGYNDSIRYDVNADGRYTNDEDINEDGVIDMKDWEIGGLRYINSSFNNDGYGLILYRALALEYGAGGIWNNQVHVIEVKEEYTPLAILRIKIKHNSRNKLKLIAGISQDTSLSIPQHNIEFPIFNYQGGDLYMQGNNDEESDKIIELSLDISPLLSYVEPESFAKYFIQVVEKDDWDVAEGEVLYYSVVDYNNSLSETISDQFPKTIANNNLTTLSLITKLDFNRVSITTDELKIIVPGEMSTNQISANGGLPPYNWDVVHPYKIESIPFDFPLNNNDQLVFDENDYSGVNVDLAFSFPYYDDTLNSITVYKEGFIMFDNMPFPYPYFIGEETILRSKKTIAPFMAELILSENGDNGVWVNSYQGYAEIIWKASSEGYENDSEVNFAVKIFSDGNIETHYGEMIYPDSELWCSGISKGDNLNYTTNSFFHHIGSPSYEAYVYVPQQNTPDYIEINQDGLLSMLISEDSNIFDVEIQVEDDHGIINRKKFQASSGLIFEYMIQAGNDDRINYFDTVSVKFVIKNISNEVYHNIEMNFNLDDPHFSILKNHAYVGSLVPQESLSIDSALIFVVSPGIPDQYSFTVSSNLSSNEKQWNAEVLLVADAPDFIMSDILVRDNHNGILEPGETAELEFQITNNGHMDIEDIWVKIDSCQNVLEIEDPIVSIDQLAVGDTVTIMLNCKARKSIATGTMIDVYLTINKDNYLLSNLKKELLVGRIPVLILDIAPDHLSGHDLMDVLDSMNIMYKYNTSYLANYDDYMSLFICLGGAFNNVELSPPEANKIYSFLIRGGNVYMESGATWDMEEQSTLNGLFNIEFVSTGNWFIYDSIYGVPGEFTKDMIFEYNHYEPYNNHYLITVGSAFPLLFSEKVNSACVIAYNEGNYKTIGSTIEFGSLVVVNSKALF